MITPQTHSPDPPHTPQPVYVCVAVCCVCATCLCVLHVCACVCLFSRADSIVFDAELIRKALVPLDNTQGKWSILGQSFGGFCAFTYLSLAPEGKTTHHSCFWMHMHTLCWSLSANPILAYNML